MRSRPKVLLRLCLLVSLALGAPLHVDRAHAETYLAVEFGGTYALSLRDIDITTVGFTSLTQRDLDLDTSFLYGARVGHFFESARWLGVETHFMVTYPGVRQQDVTLIGPGGSTTFTGVAGFNLRVMTWTPMALVLRYPGTRLQPYVGAGPGLFFARIRDKVTDDLQSDGGLGLSEGDWRMGLSANAGLRYYFSRHVAMYLEGRYTGLIRFQFKETPNLDGFDANYDAVHGIVGLGFHF